MTLVTVRSRGRLIAGLLAILLGMALLAPQAEAQERTLRVPQDYPTVQAAVDDAVSGDVVLVDRGVYNEQVTVGEGKDGITIRGVDRNEVVFDGQDELAIAIYVKGANNVRLENMTAHNYTGNGFYWQSVEGYVGRYLTTWNVGVYGIYAFDSRLGLFEHSYASGSSDSSFYIGQCYPCDATIRDVTAEYSIIGYSGTNAGGNLAVEDSLWRNNGAGIVPNSLDSEANPPQREAVVRNNVVEGSGSVPVPVKGIFEIAEGLGIVVAGGVGNVVENNTVTGSTRYGIVVTPLPDQSLWQPKDNTVRNNEVTGNATEDPAGADLAIVAGSDSGNCFEGNTFETSDPPEIESGWACDTSLSDVPGAGGPVSATNLILTFGQATACDEGLDPACNDHPSYTEMPQPPPQPNMPPEEAGKGIPGGPAEQSAAGQGEPFPSLDSTRGTDLGLDETDGDAGAAPDTTAGDDGAVAQDTDTGSGPALPTTGGGALSLLVGLGLVASSLRLRRR